MTISISTTATATSRALSDPHPPLNVLFVITSMHVGGAETLLLNLMRRLDPKRMVPALVCLKEKGELGEQLASEFSVDSDLVRHKLDPTILLRLRRVIQRESIDAVVTVGAGDKMFWGRLAARWAGVPVILSAIHSTGWPDGVGRLNRCLTSITDGFIAVAKPHQQFLIEQVGFPKQKVHQIPNGIDTRRFVLDENARDEWRSRLQIPSDAPVCGIVAALRPEKNHELFLRIADRVFSQIAHGPLCDRGRWSAA